MTKAQLRDFAAKGAAIRLQQIAEEERAIFTRFPDLRDRRRRRVVATVVDTARTPEPPKQRRKLTAAEKAKISAAMKVAWARRKRSA